MMASKRPPHHYFSVFINAPGQPQIQWFGYSERQASWQFYTAIKRAARTPDATSVDLRRDSEPLASVDVNVKTVAIA